MILCLSSVSRSRSAKWSSRIRTLAVLCGLCATQRPFLFLGKTSKADQVLLIDASEMGAVDTAPEKKGMSKKNFHGGSLPMGCGLLLLLALLCCCAIVFALDVG